MFTPMLAERVAADVVAFVLEPRRDLEVGHAFLHPLVDQLNNWASAYVAPGQDRGKVGYFHLDVELLLFGSLLLRRLLLDAELCILRVKELDQDLETRCETSRDDGSEVTAADVEQRDAETEGNRDRYRDERSAELDEGLVHACVVNDPADAGLDVAIHWDSLLPLDDDDVLVWRTARLLLLACSDLLELLLRYNDAELFLALARARGACPLPSVNGIPRSGGHVSVPLRDVLLILLEPIVLPLLVPLADLHRRVIHSLLDPDDEPCATVCREDDVVPRLRIACLGTEFLGGLDQVTEGRAVVGHALLLHKPRCLRLRLDAIASRRVNGVLGRPRHGSSRAGRAAIVENAALLYVIEL